MFFDEQFHRGVNIIHGDNGSGKSTIADFIFFALGGDLQRWRAEAATAEYVVAEIKARDAVLTLRREVSSESMRPMDIFFGTYDDAMGASIKAWEKFPYKRPDATGYSFSQVIFRAAGIPESISDGLSNITMHQLLRVIYADQLTPIQKIFRPENWDTVQIRQAVGDVLCGIGGYDLFALQLFLRDLERDFSEITGRLRGLIMVASSYGDNVLPEHIEAALKEAVSRREELNAQLTRLMNAAEEAVTGTEADKLVVRQRRDLAKAKGRYADFSDRRETLEYEIKDAAQFIEFLRSSIAEFDDSATTFYALGAVRFEFCPSCFSALDQADHASDRCHLCGRVRNPDFDEARTLAVKLDLEMQLSESIKLQEDREVQLGKIITELRASSRELAAATSASELGRRGAATQIEVAIADLSRQIGRIDVEIQTLDQRKALAEEIQELTTQKASLNERIAQMKTRIEATEASQARRKTVAYTSISERAKSLLEQDMAEHSDFGQIDSVGFDFGGDWIALNGVRERVGSASGMVVLKNSFLLGLFSAALADPAFGLPRFMLMDNIEDKGMVEERSWNFQRLILAASASSTEEHQLIFTTSKIAPELAGTSYVVGRKFTKERKTLSLG